MRIIAYVSGALVIVAIAVFALALWLIQVPPVSANSDSVEQDLNAWFDERHQQSFQHFNGAALVIRDGNVIVRKAWGKDGEGRLLTPESQFRLASVSKSFTAAAILKLADDGLICLLYTSPSPRDS